MSLEQQAVEGVRRNYFMKIENISSKLAKYLVREMFRRLSMREGKSEADLERSEGNSTSDIIAKVEEDGATAYTTKEKKEIQFIREYTTINKVAIITKYNKETEEYIFLAKPEVMKEILREMQEKEKSVDKILNETTKEIAEEVQNLTRSDNYIAISNLSELEINAIIRKLLKDKSVESEYSVIKESNENGHETYQLILSEGSVINERQDKMDVIAAVIQTRLELDGQFCDDRYEEEMEYLRIEKGLGMNFYNILGNKSTAFIVSKDNPTVISITKNGFEVGHIEKDKQGNVEFCREKIEPTPTLLMKKMEQVRINEMEEKRFFLRNMIVGTKDTILSIENPTGKKGEALLKIDNIEMTAKEATEYIYKCSDRTEIKELYEKFMLQTEQTKDISFHNEDVARLFRKAMERVERPKILNSKEELYSHFESLQENATKESSENKDQTAVFSRSFSNIVKEELSQDEEFNKLPTRERTQKILNKCSLILSNLQNFGVLSEGDLSDDRESQFMQIYKKYDVAIANCSAVPNQLNKMSRNIKYVDEKEINRLSRGSIEDILKKEMKNIKPEEKKEFTLKSILDASRDYNKKLVKTPYGRICIESTSEGKARILFNNRETSLNVIVKTITDCFEKSYARSSKKREHDFEYER